MDDIYFPGGILSMAAGAVERLISAGNGDAALLYLWLLKNGGTYYPRDAARSLRWDARRCDAAFAALVGMKLADGEKTASAPALLVRDEAPDYSKLDINRELERPSSPFPSLVQEVQRRLGKILSASDLKYLYAIYDFIGLPSEVILLVVSWCVRECERKHGPGSFPRLPQIQKEALRWKEQGADTLEAAESYLKHLELVHDRSCQILALLDIRGRPPVPREKEYIEEWLGMGFQDDAIRMAYERTVFKKRFLNWGYMNSILRSWHQKGLHTAAEITAGDTPPMPGTGKDDSGLGATVPQPVSAEEAARQTEEDMDWVFRVLGRE